MDKETQRKLLDIVKNNYDKIAEEFDETRQKRLWPEVLKLTERVHDGDAVLDVGCGNGRLTAAFINKNIKYLGIDQSQRLINLAKKNLKAVNFQFSIFNFQFKQGNISELDKVAQEKFDYIFCIAVLHHIPGKKLRFKALEQMKNRLKPEGVLVVVVWNLWRKKWKFILRSGLQKIFFANKMDWGDLLFDWKKGEISQRYYHVFSTHELKKLSYSSGFSIKKIYHDAHNYYLVLSKQN